MRIISNTDLKYILYIDHIYIYRQYMNIGTYYVIRWCEHYRMHHDAAAAAATLLTYRIHCSTEDSGASLVL